VEKTRQTGESREKKLVALSKGLLAPSDKPNTTKTGFKIRNWRIIILCDRDCLYLCALYVAKYIMSPRNNMNYYYLFIYGSSGDNNMLETCTTGESI